MDSGEGRAGEAVTPDRMKLYVGAALALLLVAALSYLLVPSGSGIGACGRLLLQNSRYSCTEAYAVSALNASACAGMPSAYSDPCYLQIAQARNDSSLCAKLSSPAESYSCAEGIYVAKGDYSACGGIGQPYSGMCREAIAEKLGNQSMCGGIGNETDTDVCVSEIGISGMLSSGNVSRCAGVAGVDDNNITGQVISNFSYSSGGAYANLTVGLEALALVPNSYFSARDFCYALAASRLSEEALCLNIGDSNARAICDSNAGLRATANTTFNYTQSLADCAEMPGSEAQVCEQATALEQAVVTRNASLCGTLNGVFYTGCYSALAKAYQNSSYCGYITNATDRVSCEGNASS